MRPCAFDDYFIYGLMVFLSHIVQEILARNLYLLKSVFRAILSLGMYSLGGRKMWSLKNKIAVVTGAGNEKSIGYAVALALRNAGVKWVFLFDINQRVPSDGNLICKTHNVTTLGSVLNYNAYIEKNYGPVDILVNCAGILEPPKAMSDYCPLDDEEPIKHIFDVNVMGAVNWYRAVISGMISRNEGCIVNMASIAGIYGRPNTSVYGASKAALINFTESWAREAAIAAPNVRVNAVAPGFVETEMTDKIDLKAREAVLRDVVPSHRTIQPAEIADVVLMLLQCTALNGAIVKADLGRIIR
jgi:3-oxoacyl-[acyl-carrier protein] reductase